jgi:hypothetical protein
LREGREVPGHKRLKVGNILKLFFIIHTFPDVWTIACNSINACSCCFISEAVGPCLWQNVIAGNLFTVCFNGVDGGHVSCNAPFK